MRLRQGRLRRGRRASRRPGEPGRSLRGRAAAARARRRPRRRPDRPDPSRAGRQPLPPERPRPRCRPSGGIRSLADAQALLDAGAARVVVGTAAWTRRTLAGARRADLEERLVVAVDARDGRVAVAGWSRMTELAPDEFAERCAEAGVRRLLCTAIDRDGTMAGPDLELLERVREPLRPRRCSRRRVRSQEDLDGAGRARPRGRGRRARAPRGRSSSPRLASAVSTGSGSSSATSTASKTSGRRASRPR